MPMPKKNRTSEWFELVGAVDLTARILASKEKFLIKCHSCSCVGNITAGNADYSLKKKGYGYKCKDCIKKILSEIASQKKGDKNPFFGKRHSNETKTKLSKIKTEHQANTNPLKRKQISQKALKAAYKKYNGNPMNNKEVKETHNKSVHSEEFINKARANGKKNALSPGFNKKQREYSNKYWNEDNKEKTLKQKNIFIKRKNSIQNWEEKRIEGYRKFLKDPERIAKAKEKIRQSCIELYGEDNWQKSDYAALSSKTFASKGELEILSWVVNDLGISARKYRSGGYEIDIFIPSLNIGIEYNGLYWHSELKKESKYHLDKTNYFNSQGIRIIHVFEHIWKDKKEQVKSFLKSALNANKNKIGARKCELIEITREKACQFLDKYHIQGSPRSILLALGLFNEKDLLGVATFGHHHRKDLSVVLNRFAGAEDWTISGGLSKITQFALEYFKQDIITWADISISDGNGYEKAGWIKEETLPPDYFYTNFKTTISKQSRKKSLVDTPEGMTEHEHALLDGFCKVYDCGKIRFRKKYINFSLLS